MNTAQPLLPARYASSVALTGIANGAVSALCAALALPLLVSALGLRQYGQWAVLGMFITTAAALDLGLSRAIVLRCAGQSKARVREYTSAAAVIALSLALVATLLIAAVSLFTGRPLGFASAALDGSVLAGGCAILFIGMLNAVFRATLESQMRAHWVNVGYLAQTLLFYGLSLIAAFHWRGREVWAAVLALAAVLVAHALMLARDGLLHLARPNLETLRDTWRTGRQSYLLAAPVAILPPVVAALVLGHVDDAAAFGEFDLALRIATLSSTLLASIAVPVLALSARAHGTGVGVSQLPSWVRRYLLAGWSVFTLGMLTLSLAGPLLLNWLFPAAGPLLHPLALLLTGALCAVTATEPVTRAILGGPRPGPVLLARTLMAAVVIVPGAWALDRSGLLAFGAVYLAAGMLATLVLLGAWFRSSSSQ